MIYLPKNLLFMFFRDTQRPERLISRLKSVSDDAGPRLTVKRQPKGPDSTSGFSQPRTLWNPPI